MVKLCMLMGAYRVSSASAASMNRGRAAASVCLSMLFSAFESARGGCYPLPRARSAGAGFDASLVARIVFSADGHLVAGFDALDLESRVRVFGDATPHWSSNTVTQTSMAGYFIAACFG